MLALALAVACQRAPVANVALAPVATIPRAPPAVPRPKVQICERVLEGQRAALAALLADARKADPELKHSSDEKLLADWTSQSGITCGPFRGGAWALELADPQANGEMVHGNLEIVSYLGDARAVAKDPIAVMWGSITSRVVTDYDGDGVPEFYVDEHVDGPEGGSSEDAKIYAVDRNGAVVPYAPTAALSIVATPDDFDGDGRMDVPTSEGVYIGVGVTCDYYKNYADTARFLAHALPNGTFSTDDEVAKRYAKGTCPAPPTAIGSPADALCARLWASTPAERAAARKLVTSSCVQWDCDREKAGKPQPKKAARDCDARRDTFDQNMPLELP